MDKRCFVLALAMLSACASQSKRQEAELAQLLDWYPGHYSSAEPALELSVVRVYAPSIGDYVFYTQETAANDPRRLITQRLVSFANVKGQGIVQSLWTLTEPMRWRDAHLNPDLFKGMQPQDFAPMRGCDLIWSQKDGRFSGANDAKACRAATSGGTLRMDLRAELTADELALATLAYDVSGRLVQGDSAEPFYRFRRR